MWARQDTIVSAVHSPGKPTPEQPRELGFCLACRACSSTPHPDRGLERSGHGSRLSEAQRQRGAPRLQRKNEEQRASELKTREDGAPSLSPKPTLLPGKRNCSVLARYDPERKCQRRCCSATATTDHDHTPTPAAPRATGPRLRREKLGVVVTSQEERDPQKIARRRRAGAQREIAAPPATQNDEGPRSLSQPEAIDAITMRRCVRSTARSDVMRVSERY